MRGLVLLLAAFGLGAATVAWRHDDATLRRCEATLDRARATAAWARRLTLRLDSIRARVTGETTRAGEVTP